jgi:hypothetical protein
MGDLNVSGEQAATARDGFEWKTYFGSIGHLLSSDFDTCFRNLFAYQLLMSRQKVLGTTGARFG